MLKSYDEMNAEQQLVWKLGFEEGKARAYADLLEKGGRWMTSHDNLTDTTQRWFQTRPEPTDLEVEPGSWRNAVGVLKDVGVTVEDDE